MQKLTRLFLFVALALCVLAPVSSVRAGLILQGGGPDFTTAAYVGGFMQGYDFVSTTNQFLTALGIWDQGADGLPASFQVGLWNTTTQTLLATAVIDNSDPLDLSVTNAGGNWRFETLGSAVALTSGTTYTLAWLNAVTLSNTDSLFLDYPALTIDPSVTIANQIRFENSSSFTFPTNTQPAGNLFRGMVNARLSTTAGASTPEPLSLAIWGVAALGMTAVCRFRRKVAA